MMLQYVENILNFGFLGLSFLMLYLGYSLIKKVVGTEVDVTPNTGKLIKNFLNVALVFMVLAGPLQWATIGIKHAVEEKKVKLHIGISKTSWEDSFGKIYIRKDGEYHPITVDNVDGEFKEDEEILLNVQEVVAAMGIMRKQIEALNSKMHTPRGIGIVKGTLDEG